MESYVSIIVPHFNRIHYLKQLIESVHKYADLPFELIIHDDASIDGSTEELWKLKDKISTLIVNTNTGRNVGLPVSTNRLVKLASSDNIIFLNNDCVFVSPCLNDIVNIINRPYVGYLHLTEAINLNKYNEVKFKLNGIRSGSAIAFRRYIYDKVEGWNEFVYSEVSDSFFMTNIIKHGYFALSAYYKELAVNLATRKQGTMGSTGYDCCYPKIFNLKGSFDKYCKLNEVVCSNISNTLKKTPGEIGNLDYWDDYLKKLLETKRGSNKAYTVDWEVAKLHGHDKWKDLIMNDDILVKE